jgi:hypothetical protein
MRAIRQPSRTFDSCNAEGVEMSARILSPVAALSLLMGCSSLTSPKEKPVIEDKVGSRMGVLATTAERRVVLIDLKEDHFCAEAAPDVAESLNSSIRIAAEYASKAASGPERTASAEFARNLSTSLSTLFSRTQGVQLFRDGSYALCQARFNGAMPDAAFQVRFDALLNHAVDLIKLEIPQVAARMSQGAVSQSQAAVADARAAAARAEAAAVAAERAASAPKQ